MSQPSSFHVGCLILPLTAWKCFIMILFYEVPLRFKICFPRETWPKMAARLHSKHVKTTKSSKIPEYLNLEISLQGSNRINHSTVCQITGQAAILSHHSSQISQHNSCLVSHIASDPSLHWSQLIEQVTVSMPANNVIPCTKVWTLKKFKLIKAFNWLYNYTASLAISAGWVAWVDIAYFPWLRYSCEQTQIYFPRRVEIFGTATQGNVWADFTRPLCSPVSWSWSIISMHTQAKMFCKRNL